MAYKAIIFDADDTLWHDSIYFVQLRKKVLEIVNRSNLQQRDIAEAVAAILRGASAGEQGFAEAAVKVGVSFNIAEESKAELCKVVKEFLDHPIELFPGVLNAIQALRCQKLVYTKGLEREQLSKLERSGLFSEFALFHCVDQKSTASLVSCLEQCGLDPSATMYVGNSVKHDIIPATEAGCSTIWFNHKGNQFGRNETLPSGVRVVGSWQELGPLLASLTKAA